jgi:hypothetical protein
MTFAPPTAGNKTYAQYYQSRFGTAAVRVHNTLDLVPHGWGGVGSIYKLYEPQISCPLSLRALFDKSTTGTAVPCYADEARDLSGMITEVLEAARLTISPEAQQQLMARLGADRGLSRSEVDKLALYAAGKGTIDIDDVEAVVGDAAELAMDRVVNAATSGAPTVSARTHVPATTLAARGKARSNRNDRLVARMASTVKRGASGSRGKYGAMASPTRDTGTTRCANRAATVCVGTVAATASRASRVSHAKARPAHSALRASRSNRAR